MVKNRRHPPAKRRAAPQPHGAGEDEPFLDDEDEGEDDNEQAGKEAYGNVLLADAPEQQSLQLQHVSAATVAVGLGGTGYALNDTVTLANGVVLKATTMTGSKIASVSIQAAGSADINTIPANPVGQVSTSGSGTGAQFNLTWSAGPPPIGATAPPTFPPTVGAAPVPVPPGSMAPIVISPAAVPPSVAGVVQPQYKTGSATVPAISAPIGTTTPPYPPIVISATFNNVAVDAGKTPAWKIVQPPTTPTVAILMKPDGDDEAGDAGTVHSRHAEPAERRRRSVLQRPDARQEY